MDEQGPYNQGYRGACGPDRRLHTLEIEYSFNPLLYHGPFKENSPFTYFSRIPQPPTADNIYTSHPSTTLGSPFTEKEITDDITRRENLRTLSTDVGAA